MRLAWKGFSKRPETTSQRDGSLSCSTVQNSSHKHKWSKHPPSPLVFRHTYMFIFGGSIGVTCQYLFVYLFVCVCVCLSIYLSIDLSIWHHIYIIWPSNGRSYLSGIYLSLRPSGLQGTRFWRPKWHPWRHPNWRSTTKCYLCRYHHITLHYIHTYSICVLCVYDPCWNSNQTWGFRSIGTKSKTQVDEGGCSL